MQENIIVSKTFDFAVQVTRYILKVNNPKLEPIVRQFLKSGTSVGANVREAQNAESRADFIHKMKIAAKEAEETEYWLDFLGRSEICPIRATCQNR